MDAETILAQIAAGDTMPEEVDILANEIARLRAENERLNSAGLGQAREMRLLQDRAAAQIEEQTARATAAEAQLAVAVGAERERCAAVVAAEIRASPHEFGTALRALRAIRALPEPTGEA